MKDNCNIIKDLLPLYIDKVCSIETSKLVEQHLVGCEECKNYLEKLKISIKSSKIEDVNIFEKFAKTINYKTLRNAFVMTCMIIAIVIPIIYLLGNYEFTLNYDESMKILIHENNAIWNFQFYAPISGYDYGEARSFMENEELTKYIFITRKYTIQDYLESKKQNGVGSTPGLDYISINPHDKIKVFYTTEDLNRIKNASKNEIENIINNSTLIFSDEIITTSISCNLNNQKYNYSLRYYKINNQIINSFGDETMPNELLIDISSTLGDYKSVWFPGDKANDIFEKIEKYINNNNGECTIS